MKGFEIGSGMWVSVIAFTCRERLSEHAPTVAKSKDAACPSTAARSQSDPVANLLLLGSLCITGSCEAFHNSMMHMIPQSKRASTS